MMNNKQATADANTPGIEQYPDRSILELAAMSGPGLTAIIEGRDTTIVFANKLFREYFGYTGKSLKGLTFKSLLDTYEHDRFLRQLEESKENSPAGNSIVIYRFVNSSSEQQTFYLYASSVNGDRSTDLYHLLLLPDRSAWGMPFTSFHTREMFLEHFNAEGFGTFEWMIDADQGFCSEGVYRIFEVAYKTKEIDLQFAARFVHPNDRQRVRESAISAFENSGDLNIEFRIVVDGGGVKLIHCLGRFIKGSNGRPVKFAGSVRDVTVQRSIENNLKNKVEELKRSNRELEEFAYAASHDLQEPLRKITTFSDRLSAQYKSALAGEGAMYLARMVASAENMRLLINGLLEFSRISQPSAPFQRVNLNDVLQDVMNDLELKIEETGTAIRTTGLPTIDAVGSQMKQLLMNLVGNAIKFHKPGVPPIIRIEVAEITEEDKTRHDLQLNKRYYKIHLTDNGIGFEDEYAALIFQVFQRLHGRAEYPGSGIGLAICKKILEYHQGVIYAENVAGTGARFVFILPEQQNA